MHGKITKGKQLFAAVAIATLIVCTICPTLAVNAEERAYIDVTIENPGEYKPAISNEDISKMENYYNGDNYYEEGLFTDNEGGYTITSNSIFVMDWSKSTISRNSVYAISIDGYYLNPPTGAGSGSGQIYYAGEYVDEPFGKEEYLDRINLSEEYVFYGITVAEEYQPDVAVLTFSYYDNNGDNKYVKYCYTVQKGTYNLSFDVSDIIKGGPEGTMYRLYNGNSGEHFYTGNVGEARNLYTVGWQYEEYAWTAPTQSNTPVYRLYNSNVGYHHYTINAGERDSLVSIGWTDEGLAWYSDDNDTTPLYRLYNPNATGQYEAGGHHYTVSIVERDQLISAGWIDEGIGWYGL